MPRPVTGSPRWNKTKQCWEARLGPNREPHEIPGLLQHEKERAQAVALIMAEKARRFGMVAATSPQTVNEWSEEWIKSRVTKGLRSVRNDAGRLTKWVLPKIGTKPMAEVNRRDLEEIVQSLDAAVRIDGIKWKTATNVWGVVTKMFSDARRSKITKLRVRDDNPAQDVEGPDRGSERSGPYLYPNEFLALMRCERVPLRWKRIFTLAVYLYARAGEIEALDWSAVNFDQRFVHIYQSADGETGEIKRTKTDDDRRVPIEPALMPLLIAMHTEAKRAGKQNGRVLVMPPHEEWAKRLRKYLGWSGCTRAELLADDAARRQIVFHDLRHTGITWRAVRGDEALKIQRAAGHDDLRTTQRYINEAEVFDQAAFGTTFPMLPKELLEGSSAIGLNRSYCNGIFTIPESTQLLTQRPQGDSNPR